jgi:hypothetical protein
MMGANAEDRGPVDWCEVFNLKLGLRDDQVDIFGHPKDNPEYYVVPVDARLSIDGRVIGRFDGSLVRGDLIANDRQDILEMLDDVSDELGKIAAHLFDTNGSYLDHIQDQCEPFGRQILLLDNLTIDIPFRGHDFGLAILQHVLRHCPHDIAIMQPYPLQHGFRNGWQRRTKAEVDAEYPEFQGVTLKAGKAKLAKYYSRLGFRPLRKTEYMVRSFTRQHDWIPIEVAEETLHGLRAAARELLEPPPE